MADRTITTDLIGRDRSLSRALNDSGDAAVRNSFHLRAFGDGADRTSERMGRLGRNLVGSTAKIALLSVAATSAVGGIHFLVGATLALGGSLLLLPAAAAAGAAVLGTLKLAMAGVGDAIKNSGDPEKYAESLKKLAPAAQATVRQIVGLKPAFEGLKKSVQGRFFAGLAAEVKPLAQAYLPMLKVRLGDIAGAGGGVVKSLTGFLRTQPAMSQINTVLGFTAQMMDRLKGAAKPLAAAFLNITSAGAQFLPGLGGGITSVAKKFEAFTAKITAGGKNSAFAGWIRTGIESLKQLGSIAGSVGSIIGGIFKASSGTGGSGLQIIADLLGKVAAQVNTPAFQGGLQKVFTGLGTASKAVGAALPAVAAGMVALAPALANIAAGAGVAFGQTLRLAAGAAIALGPALTVVSAALLPLAPMIGTIGPALWVVAKGMALCSAVAKVWTAVQTALNVVIWLGLGPVALAVAAIALLAVGLVVAYKKSDKFRAVVQASFRIVVGAAKALGSAVAGAFRGIVAAGAALIRGVVSAVAGVAGAIGRLAGVVGGGVRRAVGAARSAIGGFFQVGRQIIAGIIGGVRNGVAALVGAVRNAASSALNAAKSFLGISSPSKVFHQVGRNIGRGLVAGIVHSSKDVKHAAVRLARAVDVRFDSAIKHLKDLRAARDAYAKSIKSNLISGASITSLTVAEGAKPVAVDFINNLRKQQHALTAYARNIARLRKLGLNKTSLQQLIDGGVEGGGAGASALAGGGKSAINEVNSIQRRIGKDAGGLAKGMGNTMFGVGIQAADGLMRGLAANRRQIVALGRSLGRDVARAVRKELGIRSPSKVMHAVGMQTGAGMIGGLEASRPGVVSALSGLAAPEAGGRLASMVRPGPGASGGDTYIFQITQPLGTPQQVGDAIVTAFERRPAGAKRLPASAVAR